MKGDTTRKTFRKGKHYSGVLKQQGRVDIDADWNEQVEIEDNLRRTAVKDTLGCCAAPAKYSAFQISLDTALDQAKRLKISAGRMYVDGILCENDTPAVEIEIQKVTEEKETQVKIVSQCQQDFFRFEKDNVVEIWDGSNVSQMLKIKNIDSSIITFSSLLLLQKKPIFMRRIVTYDTQDDYPEAPQFHLDKKYLIYLDVWQRHITAIEDKSIREIALDGPDTATRIKTLWQVKLASLKSDLAGDDLTDYVTNLWADITKKRSARMAAWTEEPKGWDDCSLSPAARYRGLDNHLYRVEIHDEGIYMPKDSDWSKATVQDDTTKVSVDNSQPWRIGQLVELMKDGKSLGLLRITDKDDSQNLLSVGREIGNSGNIIDIRKVPTYKWSRDNGSVLRSVNSIDDDNNRIIISVSGQDIPKVFATGQWVEITDEGCDLREEHGVLVRLKNAMGNVLEYDKDTMVCIKSGCGGKLSKYFTDSKLKVRLWDHVSNDPSIVIDGDSPELEYGIHIHFFPGDEYKTGDYWQIPARSIDGSIEWPSYNSDDHVFVQRHGIMHHYCQLATYNGEKSIDNRILQYQTQFLPVSETITLSYVGGDAQEGFPGKYLRLSEPLKVAVLKGGLPLKDAYVKFQLMGKGKLDYTHDNIMEFNNEKGELYVPTNHDGIASAFWTLENNTENSIQHVITTLSENIRAKYNYCSSNSLKDWPDDKQTIDFHARLSTVSLEYVSGDVQEVLPGEELPKTLKVAVFKGGLPFESGIVIFKLLDNGTLTKKDRSKVNTNEGILEVETEKDGTAECYWAPEENLQKPYQQVEVWVKGYDLKKNNNDIKSCPEIFFNAKLNVPSLFYVSGDSQEVTPYMLDPSKSHKYDKSIVPIRLRVAADIGPLKQGAFVKFRIFDKSDGKLIKIGSDGNFVDKDNKNKILILPVNGKGIVECGWKLGTTEWNTGSRSLVAKLFHQTAIAKLLNNEMKDVGVPPVFFTANLNIASGVAFDVNKCTYIADYCNINQIKTPSIQDAIEALCSAKNGGSCTVVVQPNEDPGDVILKSLGNLRKKYPNTVDRDLCICLLPGDYLSKSELTLEPHQVIINDKYEMERVHLKISGCGEGSRIIIDQGIEWDFYGIESIKLKDLKLSFISSRLSIFFNSCGSVEVNSCHITGFDQKGITLKVLSCKRLLLKDSQIEASDYQEVLPFIYELLLDTSETQPPGERHILEQLKILFSYSGRGNLFTNFMHKTLPIIYNNVSVDDRKVTANFIENGLDNLNNVNGQKADMYKELIESIRTISIILKMELSHDEFVNQMSEALKNIRSKINGYFGIALCLPRKKTEGETIVIEEVIVENCTFTGAINLYDDEWIQDLDIIDPETFKDMVDKLAENENGLEYLIRSASGSLSIQNSRLSGIVTTPDLSKILEKKDFSYIIFRNIFLSNSVIEPGWLRLMGQDIKLTSDFFKSDPEWIYNFIVCTGCTLTGNSSGRNLFQIVTKVLDNGKLAEAANIDLKLI